MGIICVVIVRVVAEAISEATLTAAGASPGQLIDAAAAVLDGGGSSLPFDAIVISDSPNIAGPDDTETGMELSTPISYTQQSSFTPSATTSPSNYQNVRSTTITTPNNTATQYGYPLLLAPSVPWSSGATSASLDCVQPMYVMGSSPSHNTISSSNSSAFQSSPFYTMSARGPSLLPTWCIWNTGTMSRYQSSGGDVIELFNYCIFFETWGTNGAPYSDGISINSSPITAIDEETSSRYMILCLGSPSGGGGVTLQYYSALTGGTAAGGGRSIYDDVNTAAGTNNIPSNCMWHILADYRPVSGGYHYYLVSAGVISDILTQGSPTYSQGLFAGIQTMLSGSAVGSSTGNTVSFGATSEPLVLSVGSSFLGFTELNSATLGNIGMDHVYTYSGGGMSTTQATNIISNSFGFTSPARFFSSMTTPPAAFPPLSTDQVNNPVSIQLANGGGILAMWNKPSSPFCSMSNQTSVCLYTGSYSSCNSTNCSFAIIANSNGSYRIVAADRSGVAAIWTKSEHSTAVNLSLYMFTNFSEGCAQPEFTIYSACMSDGCDFNIVSQGPYFYIASADGSGYAGFSTQQNGSQVQFFPPGDPNIAGFVFQPVSSI